MAEIPASNSTKRIDPKMESSTIPTVFMQAWYGWRGWVARGK
jgi:hypothetical protein